MTLDEKVVFVAGAGSSGPGWSIGKATCVTLAQKGARVVALDVNLDAARETCDEVERVGGQAYALQADVTDEHAMVRAVNDAVAHYGGIDAYIANAGIGKIGGVSDTTPDDLKRIQAVNIESLLIG